MLCFEAREVQHVEDVVECCEAERQVEVQIDFELEVDKEVKRVFVEEAEQLNVVLRPSIAILCGLVYGGRVDVPRTKSAIHDLQGQYTSVWQRLGSIAVGRSNKERPGRWLVISSAPTEFVDARTKG